MSNSKGEIEISNDNKCKNPVWENENLSQIQYKVLRGHSGGVTCCHFFNNDKLALSASKDGSTHLWNVDSGRIAHTYESHQKHVTECKISADNMKMVSSSCDKSVCFWDVERGDVLWRAKQEGIVMSCDLTNDATCVVSCSDLDNAISIWDTRNGCLIHEIRDHHKSTPTCCLFSPNAHRIATTSMDKTTKVWDMRSQTTTITLRGHKNVVSSCSFAKNERYLCTSSWDKSLEVWDISTGMFRSNGSKKLVKGHDGSVSCCQFSDNAQYVVSGGYDTAIILWELSNYSKQIVLKGHDGWVTGVDISKDGKTILSSSEDSTVRIWNIESINHIPAVIENRKAMGFKIVQCEKCSKQFSIAQLEEPSNISVCVFCRLADPERNQLPYL